MVILTLGLGFFVALKKSVSEFLRGESDMANLATQVVGNFVVGLMYISALAIFIPLWISTPRYADNNVFLCLLTVGSILYFSIKLYNLC